MTPTRYEIEALVMRIQDEFLQTPAVRMTLDQIARRLDASVGLCKAVLRVLGDARRRVRTVLPAGCGAAACVARQRGLAARFGVGAPSIE